MCGGRGGGSRYLAVSRRLHAVRNRSLSTLKYIEANNEQSLTSLPFESSKREDKGMAEEEEDEEEE